jgi:hypothetical protein
VIVGHAAGEAGHGGRETAAAVHGEDLHAVGVGQKGGGKGWC